MARGLLNARLPACSGSTLVRQPGEMGFLPSPHVDANLSADTESTCLTMRQESQVQSIPKPSLPEAGLQDAAKHPS